MPARVDLDGHDVVVTITGFDRFLAFARRLRIPRAAVTNAFVLRRSETRTPWLRVWGTDFFNIKAGWFRGRGFGREFWLARGASRVLVIETSRRYRRIVLDTADPEGDAARVLAAR